MLEPTERFTNRAENYLKYRPGYPVEVAATLQRECGLSPDHWIADIGSGTGLLTTLFLDNGNAVFAVEPNAAMRAAAESVLGNYPNFTSINGTAENSALPSRSVDFVVSGQAFHWFQPEPTRLEFQRILRPNGWVAVVFNRRQPELSPIQKEYEELVRSRNPEYGKARHDRVDAGALASFFAPNACTTRDSDNYQNLDWESLRGRFLSYSSAPLAGQPGHDELMSGLSDLFARYNENGRVRFDYRTELTFGHLN